MELIQVDLASSSELRKKLISYAKSCSWQGTGQYFADLLENEEFEASERVVAAIHNGNIAGFAALVSESCVDDKNLRPYLDFLFVDEKYRNRGIARKLIENIVMIARSEKVNNIYLCTASHEEMYIKFGFRTLYKTKINDNDDCFVMGIKI